MAIPAKIKKQLEKLERMQVCEFCGKSPVQWHHTETYQGKQIQEVCCIRALCYNCHMGNSMKPKREADLTSKINAITDGLKHLKANYPKRDWVLSQMALYETRMVSIPQIFLPYAVSKDGKTVFEKMVENPALLLE